METTLAHDSECDACHRELPAGSRAWRRPDWITRRNSGLKRDPLVKCLDCYRDRSSRRNPMVASRVLGALRATPGSSAAELALATGIAHSTLRNHLPRLVAEGAVRREGKTKGARYFVAQHRGLMPAEHPHG